MLRSVWRLPASQIAKPLLLCALATLPVAKAQSQSGGALAGETRSACDAEIIESLKSASSTRVVQVNYFKKGQPLALGSQLSANTPLASNNVCMVKVIVGPGNPGPLGAPSTSDGIGIEIWLPDPANWNGRFHALGGGGWQGGPAGMPGAVASVQAAMIAASEGAISSTTDTGHTVTSGGFAVLPDGSINSRLWTDFASRSIHQQAVQSKAVASIYYGRAPRYSYWDGGSTGGRQGLRLAQDFPADFDGIIALYPAINWTRFITAELYPQIVMQQDLGGRTLSKKQLDLVSNAAIAACDKVGGEHLGYILDPSACRYDPTRDRNVLCRSAGGINDSAACINRDQGSVFNKVWYGMTSDGSVPDPALDNGWQNAPAGWATLTAKRRWFGVPRGTALYLDYPGFEGLVNPDYPFSIATHVVALELQNTTIAEPLFQNAKADGQSKWMHLSYRQLSAAYNRGMALQPQFGRINSDKPDLSAFKKRGGKLLTWHGLADEVIPSQGTVHYYNRAARAMGGMGNLRSFYRLYLVPGLGHGTPNGTSNPGAVVPNFEPGQMYRLMTDWVETNTPPPGPVTVKAGEGSTARSMQICPYPETIAYVDGSPKDASSYACSKFNGTPLQR